MKRRGENDKQKQYVAFWRVYMKNCLSTLPKQEGKRVSTGVNMKTGSLCKTRKHDVKENVNSM